MRLACVGMICWSGGRRGSGWYVVASQGGSPSGRLTAVVGRPSRVVGRWAGELRDGAVVAFVPETLRRAVEVFRVPGVLEPFPLSGSVFDGERGFEGEDWIGDAGRLLSPSSSRTWLPTL